MPDEDTSDLGSPVESAAREQLMQLFEDIRERDILDATWMAITSMLLVFAKRQAATFSAWSNLGPSQPQESIAVVETAMLVALPLAPEDEFDWPRFATVDTRRDLAETAVWLTRVLGGTDGLESAVIAYGTARAIDARFGSRFDRDFRQHSEVPVRDEHPYPVAEQDPGPFLGAHARNTRPENLPTRTMDRTRHLGLGHSGNACRIVLDFSLWGVLAPLGIDEDDLIVATLQPNLTLSEFDITHQRGTSALFTNHGPADVTHQVEAVQDQLSKVCELGARIVLAPEYCLTEDTRENLARFANSLTHPPDLIVIGAVREDKRASAVHNEAWVIVPGDPGSSEMRVLPPKLFPATHAGETENIVRGDEVRIFCTQSWTLAVLTCRDAMDDSLISALGDLGVNLLLVPAMTSKTTSLSVIATRLRATSQAFTVIAVGPALWEESGVTTRGAAGHAEAVFSGPYEHHPDPLIAPMIEGRDESWGVPGPTERGVWTYNFARRRLTWTATPAL